MASNAPALSTEDLEQSAPELLSINSITPSINQQHSDSLVDSTPIHGSYSRVVSDACARWRQRSGVDGTIPNLAVRLDTPEALNALRQEMIDGGMDSSRISIYRFSGGSRRSPHSGEIQSFGSEVHHTLVLDRGTLREVVIDPSVSKYAPVDDWDQPVDDQLPSGLTPFSDSPWIGTMGEYVDGGFLAWESYIQVG